MTDKQVTTVEAITLGERGRTQAKAIERVSGMLFSRGAVEVGYGESMLAREAVISTYLGNGVALPHCTYEDKGMIKRTALVLAQYPAGIPWGEEGDLAYLVFGLAAVGEEHLAVMSHLADVLDDESLCDRLATTTDEEYVRDALSAPAE